MTVLREITRRVCRRLVIERISQSSDLGSKLETALDSVVSDGIDVKLTRNGKHIELVLIDTATGRRVGWLERVLQASGLVHHKGFWLEPGMRGGGLGRLITDTSVEVYKQTGIRGIVIVASSTAPNKTGSGGTNGAYTWARLGFDWFSEAERRRTANEFADVVKMYMVEKAGIRRGTRAYTQWLMAHERELARTVKAATETPKSLSEFKLDGVELGKQYLTKGAQWKGVMWL